MSNPTIILNTKEACQRAIHWITQAPAGMVVTFKLPKRTPSQNDKMWAMLTDIARQAKLHGKKKSPEIWKFAFMQALGHEIKFEQGLDDKFFPIGYSSRKLSKAQMADLITYIQAYADENEIQMSNEARQ